MRAIDVVQKWVELFNAADVDTIMGLYADEASLHVAFAPPIEGKGGIRGSFEQYFAAGKLHCNVEHVHDAGESAVLEWRDSMGLLGVNVYEVRGGRIVRQRNYFDQLTFFRKLGIPLPTE